MKEYHLHPDKQFIIRENNKLIAMLEENEIPQFSQLSLPQGCTEILVGTDGIVYATINKAMGGLNHNPLEELIKKEKEIIKFYQDKLAAQKAEEEMLFRKQEEDFLKWQQEMEMLKQQKELQQQAEEIKE